MMTSKLRLLPTADVATLGSHCYLFDRAALHENVIFIPTQRVSQQMSEVVRRLKAEWPNHEPQAYEVIEALFVTPPERAAVAELARAGYLEQVPTLNMAGASQPVPGADVAPTAGETISPEVAYFRERVLNHFFKRPAFFHLPEQIDDTECEVGLVGIPVSLSRVSSGTVDAPSRLRRDSQRVGFWFDLCSQGIYTETGCDDSLPRLLCSGTRLKDFGDIGRDARTVGELFAEVARLIESRLLPNHILPVFIGGDHAVTFPVVDCYLRHYPDLVLLHLDAHNDLFYTEMVEFNPAGPIHALLAHSGLRKVLSFGLREPFNRMRRSGALDNRLHLYSVGALQRWLGQPSEFRAHLHEHVSADAPCYLTIDLDVLSAECIAGQLSTPAGPGISWRQLLELVALVMGQFNVIGCDIVEFNPHQKNRPAEDERELTALLLELIDGLRRARRAAQQPVSVTDNEVPSEPFGVRRKPAPAGSFSRLLEIDRRSAAELDYRAFLTEYALPGRPVILTGVGDQWPALSHWSLEYFLEALNVEEQVEVTRFERPNDFSSARTHPGGVRETLALMQQRRRRGLTPDDARYYVVNWQFEHNCAKLLDDYETPPFFAAILNEYVVPQPNVLRWFYIGEPGTGSPTHTDVLNSSAWLMLVRGRKHWRMVAANDRGACGRMGSWVDLFEPDHRRYPHLSQVALYETEQLPGDLMWTPPLCIHSVRNLDHSIALTQNYIDLTNLTEVYDALVSGPQVLKPQSVPGDLLARLVRLGLSGLRHRGLGDAAEPAIARLNDALAERHRLGAENTLGIVAAMRELGRWQG